MEMPKALLQRGLSEGIWSNTTKKICKFTGIIYKVQHFHIFRKWMNEQLKTIALIN